MNAKTQATSHTTPTVRRAETAREYGPFAGNDTIHGVTFDGERVWAATGPRLIAIDPASGEVAKTLERIGETGTAFDGISFVGFVAMAPQDVAVLIPPGATEDAAANKMMAELAAAFSDTVFNFTHYAMSMWAMPAAFPELTFTDIFTADGAAKLDEIFAKKCMHAAADTISFAMGETFKSAIKPQPDNAAAWVKALAKASVEPVVPVAPVIVYFGNKDVTVNPVMGAMYQKQMCGMGGNVARVQLPGEQSHFTTPPAAQPLFVPWIDDRFAGKPLENGCPK